MEGNAVVKSGDVLEIGINLARASLLTQKQNNIFKCNIMDLMK